MFVEVAIPVPLGQSFTYAVPASMSEIRAGARVLCQFGRRHVLGVVLAITQEAPKDLPLEAIKPLLSLVDKQPALPEELLSFLVELGRYYLAPIGEVLRMAIPAVERSKVGDDTKTLFDSANVRTVGRLQAFAHALDGAESKASALQKGLSPRASEILLHLVAAGPEPVANLVKQWKNARAVVQKLAELELVAIEQHELSRDPFGNADLCGEGPERDTAKALNAAQAAAVQAIDAALVPGSDKTPFLLHGVTGSGKTEVYLQVVQTCLASDGSALVLVPEIGLTPQLVARFRARFGDQIAVVHSGLSDGDRHAMWRRLREGDLRVAVGARSALFAPVKNLRLICVDEEHDGSFKQEEGVRYHARDMALLRAHRAGALCVLGSATPSLASVALWRKDKLRRLVLPDRAVTGAVLPSVEIVNLRNVGAGPSGNRLLSLPLHRALQETLDQKQQAILFLNRRGFAPSLICEGCGQIAECPNCSVALTLHKSRGDHVRCHYCDYSAPAAVTCTKCGATRMSQEGVGTERIEQLLLDSFAGVRVARLDRDVAAGLKSARILSAMRAGEVDVLVGTQMVTKGHDLPRVSLVGVLNADAALSLPDYQAAERTFQLIVQVAGRAGRGDVPGRVVIQTRNPEHPAVACALKHDVEGFWRAELSERKDANYPPFCRMLMLRADSLDESAVRRQIERAASVMRRAVAGAADVLGPSPAPVERLRNRFRYRCMVRAENRAPLYAAARAVQGLDVDRRVRLNLDIDPVAML